MAGQFRVTEDELTKLSSDISTANGQLQGEIRRLNGVIDQIAGGWKGQRRSAMVAQAPASASDGSSGSAPVAATPVK